jgi:hypothetical protein
VASFNRDARGSEPVGMGKSGYMAPEPKRRVLKSTQERISDCEVHLLFLYEAFMRFPQQYDRYKQIAAELRVLVCAKGRNEPLLLDLMDELGFTYDVHPPGPPFDKQPIDLIGWRDDPVHQDLTREVQRALGDDQKLTAILEKEAKLRRSMSLRDYTDKALAIFMAPFDYSYRDLILAVAQQCGSSHEDRGIDEPIAHMRSLVLGGCESHVAPLIGYTQHVLDGGAKFIFYLVEKGLYRARYFQRKPT